jgi:hypothetical protein
MHRRASCSNNQRVHLDNDSSKINELNARKVRRLGKETIEISKGHDYLRSCSSMAMIFSDP